jgi:dimethylaniline monooxygenase (N-oxide forming)
MKRVVIIGAGPCGLVALKEMRESGHDAILFERSATLGGVFASAAVYPNLHLTISNWAMAFSDFPDPERLCYPSAEEYLRYLQRYALQFDLERHITYHSEVYSAVLGHDGRWSLKIQLLGKQTTLSMQADAIIVATGASQVVNKTPSGLAEFSGRVIHSSDYSDEFKRDVAEKKLRVLVVGGGESGADISAELGELSPNVTVWLRRPICVAPRYLNTISEMQQIAANKTHDFPANVFLEAATTNRMSAGQNVYAYGFFRRLLWHAPVLNRTLSRMCFRSTTSAFVLNDQATYVTKNQRMCEALHEGKIEVVVCPTILTRGRTCEFHIPDGTKQQRDFDAVVLCTGFRTQFPWLRLKEFIPNPRAWFLHCFPEGLGHCLCFVGYARPHQGGVPIMAEMLSRYIALLLRGERALPIDYAAQARRDEEAEREYYFVSPDLNTLVDYNAFLEGVARRVGCEPRLPTFCILFFNFHMLAVLLLLLKYFHLNLNPLGLWFPWLLWAVTVAGFFLFDNGLLLKWWFYPNWAMWYRQRGPGAIPTLPGTVLRRVNLWKATRITMGFVLLVLWSVPTFYTQRLLSIFVFVPHAILTALGYRFRKAWGGLLRPKLFALHGTEWRVSDLFLP